MAQGLLKKQSKPTSKPSSSGITRKGSRTITPKKGKLLKQARINKKYTAGLTEKTEAMLGQRVGHLELLAHGKKRNAAPEKGKSGGTKKSTKKP